MKCKHCGFENREGVKFCEECGQPMTTAMNKFCPSCGFKNRRGVKFCEECGTALAAAPRGAPTRGGEQEIAPPPVIEVREPKKKRRLNPLWLLLLLLLMIICCLCGLLSYNVVETPGVVAPFLDPVIDQVRKVLPELPELPFLPDGNGNDNGRGADIGLDVKVTTCEDFRDLLRSANLGQDTTCFTTKNECYTDITGLDDYGDIRVSYQWDNDNKHEATCEVMTGFLRCYFPRNFQSDRIDYWISLGECEENLGYSDGWLGEDEGSEVVSGPPEPSCCTNLDPDNVTYFRDPPEVGTLYLGFDLVCSQPWEVGWDCAEWDAYVGANRDIYWSSGSCCPDENDPYRLNCEGALEDQKKSMTKIELRYGDCYWETEFQSPYYAPQPTCPTGEEMCGGSCCTIGHCSCSDGVCGCY